jgi:hypothetical protein
MGIILLHCTPAALLAPSNGALPRLAHAGPISRRERKGTPPNRDYLSSSIRYEDGKLIDEQGEHACSFECQVAPRLHADAGAPW